jgi:hypothetical protein
MGLTRAVCFLLPAPRQLLPELVGCGRGMTLMASESDLVQELPPDLQEEVRDFVAFLLHEHQRQTYKLRQDWAGALREHKEEYTALDLQKKALSWREE